MAKNIRVIILLSAILATAFLLSHCQKPISYNSDIINNTNISDYHDTNKYTYVLTIQKIEEKFLNMSLNFPVGETITHLDLMNIPGREARRKRIIDLKCGEQIAKVNPQGSWDLPPGCQKATWKIQLKKTPWSGLNASKQLAIQDRKRGWMFLPGAALFLLSNEETAPRELFLDIPKDMKSFHTLELTENGSYHLPSDYHIGLVFIGLGNYETHSTQANPVNLRHLWAEKPDFDLDEVSAANSAAVDYLSNVLGVEQDLSLDVFWFGRKGIFKTVGGSAGYKSVCVNYFKKRSILLDKVPMIILLHEQFHLLNADGPLWMQESLAQYYAMKSHHKSGILNDESFKKIVDKMTDSQAVDLGLVDIQREFEQTGNPFYYHQFYSRGVRFWLEVDQAIKTYTDGIKSLDDVVLRLLKLDFGTYGEAPSSFQDILMTVGGSKCVDLYNAYIAINSR